MKAQITLRGIGLPVAILLFSTSACFAQLNFSGSWTFDKAHSSPESDASKYEGKIVRKITQTAATISYKDVYSRPGSSDWSTADEVFGLSGQPQIEKHDKDEVKKYTTWSKDKKSLTLVFQNTYHEGGVAKELLIAETYSLSDDGKTLTISRLFKNPVTGETKTVNTYVKK